MSNWNHVIGLWKDALGEEHVSEKAEVLNLFQTATFATSQELLAVLSPASTSEVVACVTIANEYHIPLYPISGGRNWGLGSSVPPSDECVLLDLSRMNRILDYSEKMAYVTVEPGVTMQQIHDFLQRKGSGLMVAVTGGSPEASLLGNTMERGDGIGPLGDRLSNVTNMEVVLADGSRFSTGLGRLGRSQAAAVSRWGLGPSLPGIFTQSNFGIVTRLTMNLLPKPAFLQVAYFSMKDEKQLQQALDAFRPLLLHRVVDEHCLTFWNVYKLLAREQQYPWLEMQDSTPLAPTHLEHLQRWYGCVALYSASEMHGVASQQLVRQALQETVDELHFVTSHEHPEFFVDNLFLGVPSSQNVQSTYWRKRSDIPGEMNPDRDGCGVIWICPVFPMDGKTIATLSTRIEEMILSHGLEPNLGMVCCSGRHVRMFVAIVYDREVEGSDDAAMTCHNEVFQMLLKRGHFPCRLGVHSMAQLPDSVDESDAVLARIKKALDPKGILAPGRYESAGTPVK